MYHVTVPGTKKGTSGRKNLLVKVFALLGCYETCIVVSYQHFGTTYRYHFQRSSSPRK